MKTSHSYYVTAILFALTTVLLSACSNDNDGDSGSSDLTYTIGGTVTGLNSSGLVLQNNGSDDLAVTGVSFEFATALNDGAGYDVTVLSQPTGESCNVTLGNGTVNGANISNVTVTCTTLLTYTVGGTITGLSSSGLVLQNNGGDDLAVAGASFEFATALTDGAGYDVTVLSQPMGQSCDVTLGNGTVNGANISNVKVTCTTLLTYTVGGTVTGLSSSGLVLQNNGGDDLAVAGASFEFATGLADGTGYDVTVLSQPTTPAPGQSCDVASATGTVNGANVSDVTVSCHGWGTAELIEDREGGSGASDPQIAIDTVGNALAVWYQNDSTNQSNTNILANRYTAGSGWGTAELIQDVSAGSALDPQIAFDTAGNALAVWEQQDTNTRNIWANRYTAGSGWGTAELIETDNDGDASVPQIAIDAAGNALVVWEQSDGTRSNIWSNRYTVGIWGMAALIETNNDGNASAPQIAIDAAGNALAVWSQEDSNNLSSIWANRYTTGSWGAAALIETNDDGDAFSPQIAIDVAGNAMAVWYQFNSTGRSDIWANDYTAGSSWGTAVLIEANDEGNAGSPFSGPQIAFDTSGNAFAVWSQENASNRSSIWANRYTTGSWGTAELIETNDDGNAFSPQIAIDTDGNALTVWYQFDGIRSNIQSNRYTTGSGWDTARLVENNDDGKAFAPQIAIDAAGNALAVWYLDDINGRGDIWANRFE